MRLKDVEALRAEVNRLTLELSRLQQQYSEQTDCVIVHRGSELSCSDAMRAAYFDERRRAEQLAEALRDAATSIQTIADKAGRDEYLMTTDEVRCYANSRANAARAALAKGEQQ